MHSTLKVLSRVAGLSLLLSACSLLQQPAAPQTGARPVHPPQAQPVPDSKVDALFKEANRLAGKVKSGELNRVAAADQLNIYRLRLIGANQVDDNSFAMYRYLAVERDAGRLHAKPLCDLVPHLLQNKPFRREFLVEAGHDPVEPPGAACPRRDRREPGRLDRVAKPS